MNKKNYEMMERYILGFPELITAGYGLGGALKLKNVRHINNIVYAGMGGSAIAGDIVKEFVYDYAKTPFQVVRHYSLPLYVDDKTLVFISSFSGNTEETISCYKDAKKKKALIVVITSGGEIGRLAEKNGDIIIDLPVSMPPRCVLGMTLFAVLAVMEQVCASKKMSADIKNTVSRMNDYQPDFISASEIASELKNVIPVVFIDERYSSIARRIVNQFSENSKHFAHFNLMPEMNHNEVVGLCNPKGIEKNSKILFVTLDSDIERIRKRMLITEGILTKAGFKTFNVFFSDSSILYNILDAIMLFDLASLLLAAENDEDPITITRIDKLKRDLLK